MRFSRVTPARLLPCTIARLLGSLTCFLDICRERCFGMYLQPFDLWGLLSIFHFSVSFALSRSLSLSLSLALSLDPLARSHAPLACSFARLLDPLARSLASSLSCSILSLALSRSLARSVVCPIRTTHCTSCTCRSNSTPFARCSGFTRSSTNALPVSCCSGFGSILDAKIAPKPIKNQ